MNDAWNLLNPYWRQAAIDANPGFIGLPAASATSQMGDFLRFHDSRPVTSNPSTPSGPPTLPSGGLFPMLNRNWDEARRRRCPRPIVVSLVFLRKLPTASRAVDRQR